MWLQPADTPFLILRNQSKRRVTELDQRSAVTFSKDKARGKYTANEMGLEVHSAGAGRGPARHAIGQRPGP